MKATMMLSIVGLVSLVLSQFPQTGRAQTMLIEAFPKSVRQGEIISIRPLAKPPHVLNTDAPASCKVDKEKLPVMTLREDLFQCKATKKGVASIMVAVCDADKTFCKLERASIKID